MTTFQKVSLLWQAHNAAADPAFKQMWGQKAKELAETHASKAWKKMKGEESHGS